MIRVNCVRFNMTAADAQDAQLGIGGLWAGHAFILRAASWLFRHRNRPFHWLVVLSKSFEIMFSKGYLNPSLS